MKIAVFGAGGIGGYFGARLAQAGEEVALIARGRHLAAIREHGLCVESPTGDFQMTPICATDHPEDVGVVDVVILGVKAWDVRAAAEAIRPMVGSATGVLTRCKMGLKHRWRWQRSWVRNMSLSGWRQSGA